MAKEIRTKKGLMTLLKRYEEAGVTDKTKDVDNCYEAKWLSCIKQCIRDGLPMDMTDYYNTPKELRPLWKGLR